MIIILIIFESVFRIITNFTEDILNFETDVIDQELALINIVKKYFPNV